MVDEPGSAYLQALTGREVCNLLRAVPELAQSWATVAGTDAGLLGEGDPRALAALHAAATGYGSTLLSELARAGLSRILATLDTAEADCDEPEGPGEFAAVAGKVFGAAAGRLFLVAVAAGDDAFAAEVASRLAELQDVAVSNAASGEAAAADAGCAESSGAHGEPALRALAERTAELLAQGTALAGMLRAAADDAAAGRPVAGTGEDLAEWSAAVIRHLADTAAVAQADDLITLSRRLDELVARAQAEAEEREHRRQEALRGARVLHEQGLDALIPGMLQAAGFGTLEDWRTAIGVMPTDSAEIAPAEVETTPVGAAPEPEEEPEPAPEPVPEPQPEPHSEPEPQQLQSLTTLVMPSGNADAPDVALPVEEVPAPGEAPAPEEAAATVSEASVADEVLSSWDGTPSLIASLVRDGREACAICVAEAADEAPMRRRLLKFFCGAFSCSPAVLERQLPELSPLDAEVEEMDADECRLLLATVLRVGLSVGYSTVGLPSLIDKAELGQGGIRALADAAAEVIQRGFRRDTGNSIMQQAGLGKDWSAFGGRAQELQDGLAHSTVVFRRASNVLHHLVRKDQPVGLALALVSELAALGMDTAIAEAHGDEWSHIEKMAADLGNGTARDRLITGADRAVSTGTQLRKRIVGGALTRLDAALCEVGSLLAGFLAIRTAIRQVSTQADLRSADALVHALDKLTEDGELSSVGDAALHRLTDWLRAGAPSASAESVSVLVRAELEPLYEIPRDTSGSPLRPPTRAEAAELLRGRDRLAVVRGYLQTGNITAARAIAMKADEADQTALDDEIQRGAQEARRRHAQALDTAGRIAARLRAVNDDNGARELTAETDKLHEAPDGRFDLAIGALQDLAEDGTARLRAYHAGLRERARRCDCGESDRQRILSLIERDDEILAIEFLTMAEAGQRLPDADEQHGDDFSAFFPAMVNVAVAAARDQMDAISAIRTAAQTTGGPSNRQLSYGLEAWRELRRRKRGGPEPRFRERVADVLRMIGLVPRDQIWLQEISRTQRSGYATFRVRATPVDRSYVPSLGTQANNDYDLTLVWDAVTPTRLLDFIDEKRRTRANIIVYFNTLDPEQRLQLRRLTSHNGGKGFSPVVVDDAVAGWLSALAEPGWRFTQRVTLPFTTINPYTPFAGGEVPEEVFVGRAQEREQIESPTGSMFVYGGRQLGKSAVLRRVERMFTDDWEPPKDSKWHARTGRVAVYLDLKAASIGEAQEPAALWTVLAERLRDAGVLPPSRDRVPAPDEVTRQLSGWLNADDGNRLLLLLDEADNFLTADSRARDSGVGAEFPTLQRLKGLMETSGRRFKAVFAGLHQVQRFHDSSNTPVAHGGDDILIGPLATLDAYHLVVDPMTALGYEFASPDVVWRLLLFANYQASLVQIVCEALVRELSRRQPAAEGGRIIITAADVESVIAKREARNLIVQRFWWTINLDPRYRVIALVVAVRSLDSGPGETFTPEDLQEFCELYWPKGFAGGQLTSKEFRRYLEEMVGLGVLYRQADQYGLRSPNILGLLGTRQALEQALDDAPRDLEIPYEYNTSMNRRIMGRSTELWAPRSPLTDRDIAGLLGLDGQSHGQVQIVTGSRALTIDRAAQVIQDAAEEQQIRCELLRPEEITAAVLRRGRMHVVVDLSDASTVIAADDLPAVYAKLAGFDRVTATILVGPAGLPLRLEGIDPADVTPIRRWSVEGLRSWHESPFYNPALRTRLYRVTSGWPLLVEETMRQITNGKSPDDALDLIVERFANQDFARDHLTACGIDHGLAIQWAAELSVVGDDGLDQAFPASMMELSGALGIDVRPVIERLEALDAVEVTPDGWVLDRAVYAAAASLRP